MRSGNGDRRYVDRESRREIVNAKDCLDWTWRFIGNGGGTDGDLDSCIDVLYERANAPCWHGKREIKDFCLRYSFFACAAGAIYPVYDDEYTSIDFLKTTVEKR